MKYQRPKNLVIRLTAVPHLAATFLGQQMKLRLLSEKMLIPSQRFSGSRPSVFMHRPMAAEEFSRKTSSVRRKRRPPAYNWISPSAGRIRKFLGNSCPLTAFDDRLGSTLQSAFLLPFPTD